MSIIWYEHLLLLWFVFVFLFRDYVQSFIQALLSKAVFSQRFSFFTVCLVKYLCEVLPWLVSKRTFLNFGSSDYWKLHFRHSFWLQNPGSILPCTSFVCSGSNFSWSFRVSCRVLWDKSFITPFQIEFLLPLIGCRKVVGKMPDVLTEKYL